MSSPPTSANIRTVPIYANTIFCLETDKQIRITSNVNGQSIIYRLDLDSIEKTKSIARILLNSNVKLLPPFLTMNTESKFGARYTAKITFIFASAETRLMFTELTTIPKILVENGFSEQTSGDASDGKFSVSYTGNKLVGMSGFNTAFTEISAEIATRTETPCDANSQLVATFTIPEDCFSIEQPSPRAGNNTPSDKIQGDKIADYPAAKE